MKTLINQAVQKLEDNFILYDEYFWYEKPHMGNYLRGGTFESFENGVEDIHLVRFKSLDDYARYHGLNSIDELIAEGIADDDIMNTIKEKGEYIAVYDAYRDKIYKCDDEGDILYQFSQAITDGKGVSIYTKDEALNILKNEEEHKYHDVYTLARFILETI